MGREYTKPETISKYQARSSVLQEDVYAFATQSNLSNFEPTPENFEVLSEIQRNLFLMARDASLAACVLFTTLKLMSNQIEVAKAAKAKALLQNLGDVP